MWTYDINVLNTREAQNDEKGSSQGGQGWNSNKF